MSYEPLALPDRVQLSPDQATKASKDFLAYMKKRHSVRDYANTAVPREVIENIIATAASAPSGANRQPWHFVAVADPDMKAQIRAAAEKEEKSFYQGGAGDEWLSALEPIGTGVEKPHLTDAPWLIVVFAERYGLNPDGSRYKNYYINESVGIALGFLIAAIHNAGLVCLEHTPNPMKFLNTLCNRPINEKPVMVIPVGYPTETATIPAAAKQKKPLDKVSSFF
jgi:iodotyrosine deiodinase